MSKARKLVFIAVIIIIALLGWLFYKGTFGPHPRLVKTTFKNLPNWDKDNQADAFRAFKQSCSKILKQKSDSAFHKVLAYGQVKNWQDVCVAANQFEKISADQARQFFETWFEPYQVQNNFDSTGLFTGYYLPLLHGHLKRTKHYNVPIYALPKDLVRVNVSDFFPQLGSHTIIGQVKENKLYPYPDRAAIENSALGKKTHVIAWGNNLIDIFFAQIQGSAIVQLSKHKQIVIGYASGNGQPYTAIGKVLLANKALQKSEISMQAIHHWLTTHPDQMKEILNQNANFVFFRKLKGKEPLGAEQVPVTPQRTLAVDPHYIALGAPLWLDTVIPDASPKRQTVFQHLLIAQDTGGAIKGVVRGDVYWGAGEKAAYTAGHMASPGRYWVLLPTKKLTV